MWAYAFDPESGDWTVIGFIGRHDYFRLGAVGVRRVMDFIERQNPNETITWGGW